MHAVLYRTTGFDGIGLIRLLWEQLNEYHLAKASRFREQYEQMTFEDRQSHFCRLHESGHLRLDLAQDKKTSRIIGYCVSSVSGDNTGEIESLFVDREFRSAGTGTALVTRGLGWRTPWGRSGNGYPWVTATSLRGLFTGNSVFTLG